MPVFVTRHRALGGVAGGGNDRSEHVEIPDSVWSAPMTEADRAALVMGWSWGNHCPWPYKEGKYVIGPVREQDGEFVFEAVGPYASWTMTIIGPFDMSGPW